MLEGLREGGISKKQWAWPLRRGPGPASGQLAGAGAGRDSLALRPCWPVGDAELAAGRRRPAGALFDPDRAPAGRRPGSAQADAPAAGATMTAACPWGWTATLAASDPLSRGRYDGDVFEKMAGEARTGLGRIEIGLTDGAGYGLAVTGPKVDAQRVAGRSAHELLPRPRHPSRRDRHVRAAHRSRRIQSNYAKFAYTSPALFGAQLALSFTPNRGQGGLPFLNAGPHVPGRQADIWEGALRYADEFGPVSLSAYGARGRRTRRAQAAGAGRRQRSGLGLARRLSVNDDIGLSLGGVLSAEQCLCLRHQPEHGRPAPPARCMSAPR